MPALPMQQDRRNAADQVARRIIAEELGHSRTEVTKNYLGLPLQ